MMVTRKIDWYARERSRMQGGEGITGMAAPPRSALADLAVRAVIGDVTNQLQRAFCNRFLAIVGQYREREWQPIDLTIP